MSAVCWKTTSVPGTVGSVATHSRTPPGVLPCCTSNLPIVVVTRYDAIGRSSFQRNVVVSPRSTCAASTPLEAATSPFGTFIEMVYVALSLGWSLEGNQVLAAFGSQATSAPSSVATHP